MSEEADQDSKTEEPTAKRMREAREKGNVPSSRDVNNWFMILALAIFVFSMMGFVAQLLFETMGRIFANVHTLTFDPGAVSQFFGATRWELLLAMGAPLALTVVFALAGGVVQNGILFSAESLKPKFDKIDPIKGLKRLFSLRSVVEFLKSVFKLVVVAGLSALIIIPAFDDLALLPQLDIIPSLEYLRDEALKLVVAVLFAITAIAFLDLMYQRYEHRKKLKMTKQEVKDEHKQTEGDPHIKGKLRQIRMERSRKRMMAAVPTADVVVTNPTHFACALKYDADIHAAPILVAKGTDLVAKRIRDMAEEYEIPIVENPPLARALFAGVELDQEVPQEHYKAVAEVIGYMMRLKNQRIKL